MKEKNFIRHTRPKGRREIKQTIGDIERQIHYWQALGVHEYEIRFWNKTKKCLENRLETFCAEKERGNKHARANERKE